MRILHISNGFPPLGTAGVELYTYHLAKSQVRAGNDVYVFCRSGIKENPEYSIKEDAVGKVKITRINNNFIYTFYNPFIFRRPEVDNIFEKYVKDISPDIIHIQHLLGLSMGIVNIINKFKIPYVITLHDYWYLCPWIFLLRKNGGLCFGPNQGKNCSQYCPQEKVMLRNLLICLKPIFRIWCKLPLGLKNVLWYKNPLLKRILFRKIKGNAQNKNMYYVRPQKTLAILKGADLIIAPSNFIKNIHVNNGVANDKIKIIGNPFDKDLLKGFQKRKVNKHVKFGFIGTFSRHKGIDLLVDAFGRVKGQRCKLYIYGQEGSDENLNNYIKKKSKKDPRIKIEGSFEYKKIKKILQDLDVIIVPSIWQEPFNYVLHEALYVGIPVIASDLETFKDWVKDGKTGYLFERNSQCDLSEKIELMLKKKLYLKNKPGSIKENDVKTYNDKILDLYKNICTENPKGWKRR